MEFRAVLLLAVCSVAVGQRGAAPAGRPSSAAGGGSGWQQGGIRNGGNRGWGGRGRSATQTILPVYPFPYPPVWPPFDPSPAPTDLAQPSPANVIVMAPPAGPPAAYEPPVPRIAPVEPRP